MGDLNAKSKLWGADKNNENGDLLENLIMENDCIIVNNKSSTHIIFNGKTSSILVYCIISTNLFGIFQEFMVLEEEDMTSDHLPYTVNFKIKNTNSNIKSQHSKECNTNKSKNYNFNKAYWNSFKRNLPTSANSNIRNDVFLLEEFVCKSLIKAADTAIPIYQSNDKNIKKLPQYILTLIKVRKRARKLTKNDPNCPHANRVYNKLNDTIREESKALKDKEWRDFTQKLGDNPPSTKPFWRRINTIRGKKNNSSIPTLKINNKTYESDEQKAKLFSDILHKTFSTDNNANFDNIFKSKVEKFVSDYKRKEHLNSQSDVFNIKELNMIIKKLNVKSACGEDKIHNLMLLNSTQEFRAIILQLINESVKQSKIPKS